MLMGLAGGIFFPVELFSPPLNLLSRVTFHYWAMAGYLKLALGGGATSILPHSLILTAMGVLFFAVGSRLLRRRIGFL
jgi:ABC-type multidrug transport system permease subunit